MIDRSLVLHLPGGMVTINVQLDSEETIPYVAEHKLHVGHGDGWCRVSALAHRENHAGQPTKIVYLSVLIERLTTGVYVHTPRLTMEGEGTFKLMCTPTQTLRMFRYMRANGRGLRALSLLLDMLANNDVALYARHRHVVDDLLGFVAIPHKTVTVLGEELYVYPALITGGNGLLITTASGAKPRFATVDDAVYAYAKATYVTTTLHDDATVVDNYAVQPHQDCTGSRVKALLHVHNTWCAIDENVFADVYRHAVLICAPTALATMDLAGDDNWYTRRLRCLLMEDKDG